MIQYTCKADNPPPWDLEAMICHCSVRASLAAARSSLNVSRLRMTPPCPMSTPPPDAPLHRRPPPWPLVPGAGAAAISWPWSVPVPGRSRQQDLATWGLLFNAAKWSGVHPSLSRALTWAPCANRTLQPGACCSMRPSGAASTRRCRAH
jgi:hypothetical protein